jgi:hypothetical protein
VTAAPIVGENIIGIRCWGNEASAARPEKLVDYRSEISFHYLGRRP